MYYTYFACSRKALIYNFHVCSPFKRTAVWLFSSRHPKAGAEGSSLTWFQWHRFCEVVVRSATCGVLWLTELGPPASAGLGEPPASGEAASKAVLSVLPLCSWTLNVAAAVDFFFPLIQHARNKPAGRDFLWLLPWMQHWLAHEWKGRLQRVISNSLWAACAGWLHHRHSYSAVKRMLFLHYTFFFTYTLFFTHTGDSTCWAPWFRCDICSSQWI